MSKHDEDTCPHLVRASLLEAENARLKAEVKNLTDVVSDLRISAEDDLHDIESARIENARLRASSFTTAVPVEQYERLLKAGDAVALDYAERIEIEAGNPAKTLMKTVPVLREWNAAKEGKPSV